MQNHRPSALRPVKLSQYLLSESYRCESCALGNVSWPPSINAMPTSETYHCLGPRSVYLPRGLFLLVLTLSFLPIDGARADTVIRIVETWPSGNYVTLGKNEKFYLRLA